jgi:adenylate kinase family enzyme
MVIGGPGSGKSTFARRLHEITGLPLFHLDKLHWRPGWVAPPKEEWRELLAVLSAREAWIMDGGYNSSFDLRMPHADTILWLDIPRRIAFPRVLKRAGLGFGRVRADMAPGCPERFDWAFLKFAWTFRSAHAAKYRLALATYAPHARVMMFQSSREAGEFLGNLRR